MKTILQTSFRLLAACLLLSTLNPQLSTSHAAAPTQLGDVVLRGTLTAPAGSTVDFSLATVTLPADVTRLGSSISLSSEVDGILSLANGGTGTASPALVAGANIALSGTFPAQTVALSGIVPVANGGSGTATPGLIAGANIGISGTWPNQTITGSGGGGSGGASFVSPPVFSNSPGTAGQIAYDADYFYIAVANNTWKRTALESFAAAPGIQTLLTYVSDGDANGVFYFLGTANRTTSWTNPQTSGAISITTSIPMLGTKDQLVDRQESDIYLDQQAGSYFTVDLGEGRALAVSAFSYRARSGPGSYPTAYTILGSDDGSTWTTIIAVTGIVISSNQWLTTAITGQSTSYRFLRLRCDALDSSGFEYFTIGEWEFYGNLSY